jgi:hypothetical protein
MTYDQNAMNQQRRRRKKVSTAGAVTAEGRREPAPLIDQFRPLPLTFPFPVTFPMTVPLP